MALNIPNVAAPSLDQGGQSYNALEKGNLENAFYAPVKLAEAASKTAFANLMGPQYLAKALGNENILANLNEDQKREALNRMYSAGMAPSSAQTLISGNNNSLTNMPGTQEDTSSISGWLSNKLRNVLSSTPETVKSQPNAVSPQAMQNAAMQPMQLAQSAPITQTGQSFPVLRPGQSTTVDENGNFTAPVNQPTFAQNTGTYKGIVAQGEALGKINAKDIGDLNDIAFNGSVKQQDLDQLSGVVGSKEFEQIRQTPILGHHELDYYAKFGTPEQQQMVGRYMTLTNSIIKDSVKDFGGAKFLRGEFQLLQTMKVQPGDTVDTARGKLQALQYMSQVLNQKAKLMSNYMTQNPGMTKLQAQEAAEKQMDLGKISDTVEDKVNPPMTIRNKKTGEVKTVPHSQGRKMMSLTMTYDPNTGQSNGVPNG